MVAGKGLNAVSIIVKAPTGAPSSQTTPVHFSVIAVDAVVDNFAKVSQVTLVSARHLQGIAANGLSDAGEAAADW
jgi:hypothetical protein